MKIDLGHGHTVEIHEGHRDILVTFANTNTVQDKTFDLNSSVAFHAAFGESIKKLRKKLS